MTGPDNDPSNDGCLIVGLIVLGAIVLAVYVIVVGR